MPQRHENGLTRMLPFGVVQERTFNLYYAHLALRLCKFDHNMKFTFQYAYWDQFKEVHFWSMCY
jgi:nucleolar MIF4G domain-containing protein 1